MWYRLRYFLIGKLIYVCFVLWNSIVFSQPLASGYGKFLGSAADPSVPSSFDSYWNQITPGNAGKWGSAEPARGQFTWSADLYYNYAKQHGIPFKWHTLIWGAQQPAWIETLSAAEQLQEIKNWFSAVAARYPEIDLIDVVNEPLHQPPDNQHYGKYIQALGGAGATGYDWVIKAFELARQYFGPKVKLLINEFSIIGGNQATTDYLQVIQLLQARNLIDGIGVQGHRFELEGADVGTMQNNLNRLAATGLPIYISEFDVAPQNIVNDATQLAEMKRIFPMLWQHPGVKGITFWGYIEGQVWQTSTYLVRSDGSERPALVWLRNYLTAGAYRTRQSGNWNDANTWERRNDTMWVSASNPPAITDNAISILSGDTVTITATDSADQLTVVLGGVMMIDSGVTFLVKKGEGTDLLVNGTVMNFGILAQEDSVEIIFTDRYIHEQDGGILPKAVWKQNSTCEINKVVNTVPSYTVQNFYNFTWNCPSQSVNANLGLQNGTTTISGTLTVTSTNWNHDLSLNPQHQISLFSGAGSCSVNNIIINGSDAALVAQGSAYIDTMTVNGTITLSNGGLFSLSADSAGKTTCLVNGDFVVTDSAYIGKSYASNLSKLIFNKSGVQNFTLPATGTTFVGAPSFVVDSGATLNVGTSVLRGTGSFLVQSNGTLQSGHSAGINGNVACTGENGGGNFFSKNASYCYNGSSAQLTGTLLPDTVQGLTIDNSAGVALSHGVTINGLLEMKKGILSSAGNGVTYGRSGSLKYSGSSSQTTTDVEFPLSNGPKDVIIANITTAGVTLHASRTITYLNLSSGRFTVGVNTLSADSVFNGNATSRYVVTSGGGTLRLASVRTSQVLFPVGAAAYAPVWIANSGDADTISVGVIDDATPATFGGRVKVKWNINENTNGGGLYTLQFGWGTTLEDVTFKTNKAHNAHIFWMSDTTEAGTGDYWQRLSTYPSYLGRGGITALGSFAVGRFKDVPDVVGVERDDTKMPTEFSLYQNYPNPFNPLTTISFDLPERADVHLIVYDVLGKVVKEKKAGRFEPGNHKMKVDASHLSSGIYFYKLEAGKYLGIKKMILLK